MHYTASWASPLGGITMASDGEALTGLWFDGQKYFGQSLSGRRSCRYSAGQRSGLPSIFREASRILHRRWLWMHRPSAWRYGKSCVRSPMGG